MVDGRTDYSDVPDDQSLLAGSLHEAVFLEEVFDEAGDAVGEAVLVSSVADLDIQVVAGPVLEDEVPDAYPIR